MPNTVLPENFYSDVPPARIIGTECEYNLQLPGSLSVDRVAGAFIRPEVVRRAGLAIASDFASNGSKIYKDMGHLEYSTPECLGPLQAAAADMAGIIVMQNVVNASELEHNGLYRIAGSSLPAKDGSSRSQSQTNGYHENFQFPRSLIHTTADSEILSALMTAHLVSRIWNMSGTVRSGYVFSQKVWGIGEGFTYGLGDRTTHGSKPMVTIPSEMFDDTVGGNTDWARLEVRFADAGLEPDSRYIGLAATSLVLRLAEQAYRLDKHRFTDIMPVDPERTARIFAGDLSLLHTEETVGGQRMTALDIQDVLLDYVIELDEKVDLPTDERNAIDQWCNLVDGMKNSRPDLADYNDLIEELDVAARHYYLARTTEPGEINHHNLEIAQKNLIWDRVVPEGGGQKWWKRFPARFVTDQIIQPLVAEPPRTRAAARARHIVEPKRDIKYVEWSRIEYDDRSEKFFPDAYDDEG